MKTKSLLTLSVVVSLAGAATGWALTRYRHDPLFGLPEFPVDEYQHDYRPLTGKNFKCHWQYDSMLTGQNGTRLVVFTRAREAWPITVVVPAEIARTLEMAPGKMFSMEVAVEEKGLIYAKLCRAY